MSDRYKGAILSPTAPTVTPQSAGGIYTSSQQLQYQGQGVWSQAVNNPINNSLRFRNSASAYLNRTGGTSTSRRIHTFSFWTKSSVIGGTRTVISAGPDDSNREVIFIDSNKFTYQVKISNTFYDLETTQVFRDPAAWYHFVVAVDTTQATSSNRVKIYVNGSQITAFGTAVYPPQNADLFFDDSNGSVSYIGALRGYLGSFNYDGYFTEFNFIDGTALTPSSFGTTDAYGIWQPIPYTGSYGTNGFYLPFTDNSALTTSSNVGLGKDFSGNGNYWVTNNISITAGSTYDSMKDVPTNTNSNTANYCVMSPIDNGGNTLSNGNLTVVSPVGTAPMTKGTFGVSSGKWYWEVTPTALGSSSIGIAGATVPSSETVGTNPLSWGYLQDARKYNNTSATSYGSSYTTNDVIGVVLDMDAGTLTYYKNNTSQGQAFSGITGTVLPALSDFSADPATTWQVNFGQRPFAYTPPSGFYPLNTYNLPTPTILDGDQYMDATLITGTAATQVITNSGSMQPDMVWLKSRSNANNHTLYDAIRGVNTLLYPNLTNAEAVGSAQLTAFNSNGFTLGASENANDQVGELSVGWQWRASNAAGVSNTQGTITSTVSANTTAGFSIVTYTGTGGSGTTTVGHGLGVAPSMVIVKSRSDSYNWAVYHTGLTSTSYYLILNSAAGQANYGSTFISPSSSTLTIDAGSSLLNQSTRNYVAYVFSQVAGYSAFGSYTGNGSTDGPFIYTGFRPAFILTKNITTGGYWWEMVDDQRSPYNTSDKTLYANVPDSEYTSSTYNKDLVSNGFKIRGTSAAQNSSGDTYIYMAFAENPFKIARGR